MSSYIGVSTLKHSNSMILDEERIEIYDPLNPLLSNAIGEDPWWNVSYRWRVCINITNPGTYNLTDNYISIEFDYINLRDNYNMDPDLYDVRIVENNIVRNYYVKKDFPSNNFATIWFETNATAGESEFDTFMYWGNASINSRGPNHVSYDPSGTSWWSFEEGSGSYGSNVIDSNNFANATLWGRTSSDSPTYDADSAVGSYSLNFDGTNDIVYINDELHYTEPNEISALTVSLWFKTSYSTGGQWDNWAFFDFDRSEYFNFFIRPDDGRIGFSSAASGYSGQNDFYGSTTGLNDGEWHFACVVYDGTDKIVYIDDGIEDARWVNAMNGLAMGSGTDRWGFFGDGSEASSENGNRNNFYYEGNMDEIRFFEYAVSPDEIKWMANYQPIETSLLPVTERAASVTIIVKDVDGRLVPGAEVSLWDNLTHILEVGTTTYTSLTQSDGTVSFTKVPFGFYNISVNYTLNSGLYEEIVYDGRSGPSGEVEFKGLIVNTNVTTNLWTIDFEVNDWEGDPLDFGYVEVSPGTNEVLESLTLDSAGEATFRWLNRTSYNYTVYYNNVDYTIQNPTHLNSSTINRSGPMVYHELITTSLSKLDIRVIDDTATVPVEGITVRVEINGTGEHVTSLKTDNNGTAYGIINDNLGFWYKREEVYNLSLWVVTEQRTFRVNNSDQYFNPITIVDYYNYTLNSASSLVFELDLNYQNRISRFQNGSLISDTIVTWNQNMTFSINYTISDTAGVSWVGDDGTGTSINCIIKDTTLGNPIILEKSMVLIGGGIYTIEINSSQFSAGNYGKSYIVTISGQKSYYNNPIDEVFLVLINPMSTAMSLHNYSSMPDELVDNEISQYYNEVINMTIRFYEVTTDSSLVADVFTYDWDYGSGTVSLDPLNPGYYTIEIDTSAAVNVGTYRIELTAGLENYTKIDNFGFYINILSRPTTLNGSSGIVYVSEDIFIYEALNFTFDYYDAMSAAPLTDLDEKSYLLQKLDENGDPILGTDETGSLLETADFKFVLDLDTEGRGDGEYSIIITLDKLNYDHRIVIISLTIKKRIINFELSSEFVGSKIEIASGAKLVFTLTLTDPNNDSVVIQNANVNLTLRGQDYQFVPNGDGTYTVTIPKIVDAFFLPETFTATLTMSKQDFSTVESTITIVVNMHETFGFPTFYLLMIVGAAIAVAASLTIYRTVQQARIPKFVKRVRKMKKEIKSGKSISESVLYDSKDEYMVKKLGDRWEMIGLSLKNTLGVEDKKKKKTTESTMEYKKSQGGGV
jgi:hypothetical protein